MTSTAEKRQMKSAARLYAVQALFQMESSGQTVQAITREFESHRFGATYDEGEFVEGDVDHFRAVVAASPPSPPATITAAFSAGSRSIGYQIAKALNAAIRRACIALLWWWLAKRSTSTLRVL